MEPEESRKGGGARRDAADAPSTAAETAAVEAAEAEPSAPAGPRPQATEGRPYATGGVTVPVISADTDPAAEPAPAPRAASAQAAAASGQSAAGAQGAAVQAAAGKKDARSAAAAGSSGPGEDAADEAAGPAGRVSKPMVAAAALAGVLLLCSPFLIKGLVGHGSDDAKQPPAAGTDYDGQGRGAGIVPGADQPQGNQGPPGGNDGGSGGSGNGGSGDGGSAGAGAPADGGHSSPPPKDDKTYAAVAGPDCTNSTTGYKEHGTYSDGDKGWTTHDGGYGKEGCGGKFTSVPMAGEQGDDGNYALWTFATGPVTSGSCQVRVYIPKDSAVAHVGGHPTRYSVYGAAGATGKPLGDFTVNQVDKRGSWVSGGSFAITGGHLAVKLHTRGVDYGSGFAGAHHAAAAVGVKCTG
ncbi:hypothetical protein [Streptomyces sp. NPDC048644]|uniref:hypothetical protein n=1 Tax=Streptomyces sp. NPDC048644 TaxID=3365582 RepID=UPI00370F8437